MTTPVILFHVQLCCHAGQWVTFSTHDVLADARAVYEGTCRRFNADHPSVYVRLIKTVEIQIEPWEPTTLPQDPSEP